MFLSMTQKIKQDTNDDKDIIDITKKYYALAHSEVLEQELDIEFEIKKKIADHFSIPFSSIKIVGSAHIGSSPFKEKIFCKTKSDLDISIIDERIFNFYLQKILLITDSYSNLTFFSSKYSDTPKTFRYKVSKGILDFTLLKSIDTIDDFEKFFRTLSNSYYNWFKNINAQIYLSETCMILKQVDNIKKIKDTQYDKVRY
ncbi:MAG: hypothetical protein PHN18_02995 [Sulfurospirillaceae bacterium]|nr:hypothetical protein [Sulfurospirillaceae bacterium]MDD2825626.1 hypothetical protein [Sulfurospirillaceae bacterium]